MLKKIAPTFAALLFAVAAVAAPPSEKAAKPFTGEDLQCLTGTWTGKGSAKMGGQDIQLTASYKCRKAAGGAGVACEAEIKGIPGMDTYLQTDIWGVNPADGTVHWFAVTNGGETHDHKGTVTGNSWSGQFREVTGGKTFIESVRLAFEGDNQLAMSSRSTLDGVEVSSMQMTMTKQEAPRVARKRR